MNAPASGKTLEQFQKVIENHIRRRYRRVAGGKFRCRKCKAKILTAITHVSLHFELFGDSHAGGGEVKMVALPYCPNCEGEPTQTSTCVHI